MVKSTRFALAIASLVTGAGAVAIKFDACTTSATTVGIIGAWDPGEWWNLAPAPLTETSAGSKIWEIDLAAAGKTATDGNHYKIIVDGSVSPVLESGTAACHWQYEERIFKADQVGSDGKLSIVDGCLDSGACPVAAPASSDFKVMQCDPKWDKIGLRVQRQGAGDWWGRAPIEMASIVSEGKTYWTYELLQVDGAFEAGATYQYVGKTASGDWEGLVNLHWGLPECHSQNNDRFLSPGGWGNSMNNADDDVEGCLNDRTCPADALTHGDPAVEGPASFTFTFESCRADTADDQVTYQIDGMPGTGNWYELPGLAAVRDGTIYTLSFPHALTGDYIPSKTAKYKIKVNGNPPDIDDRAGKLGGRANCWGQYNEMTLMWQWEEPIDVYGCPADDLCTHRPPQAIAVAPATFTFEFDACHSSETVEYRIEGSPTSAESEWWNRIKIPAVRTGDTDKWTLTFPNALTGDWIPPNKATYKVYINGAVNLIDVDREGVVGGRGKCTQQYEDQIMLDEWVAPKDVYGCPEDNTCAHRPVPIVKTGVKDGMFVNKAYTPSPAQGYPSSQIPMAVSDATGCEAACDNENKNTPAACGIWTYDYTASTCKYAAAKPLPMSPTDFTADESSVSGVADAGRYETVRTASGCCYESNRGFQLMEWGGCNHAGLSAGNTIFVATQAQADTYAGIEWIPGAVVVEDIVSAEACQAKCVAENSVSGGECTHFGWDMEGTDAHDCWMLKDSGCTGEQYSVYPGRIGGPAVCPSDSACPTASSTAAPDSTAAADSTAAVDVDTSANDPPAVGTDSTTLDAASVAFIGALARSIIPAASVSDEGAQTALVAAVTQWWADNVDVVNESASSSSIVDLILADTAVVTALTDNGVDVAAATAAAQAFSESYTADSATGIAASLLVLAVAAVAHL